MKWEEYRKHFCCIQKHMIASRKSTCVIVSQELNEPLLSFHGTPFPLKEELTNYGYSDSGMRQIFSQKMNKG